MIRTHRPRGFAWNCPSAFQQTELFRQINYEDCVIDEDDFPDSQRATKRRRIEALADDYLNGQPLYISSARLVPQSMHNAVCRSFRRPKDGRAILAERPVESTLVNGSGQLWEDVQDEFEIMRDFNRQQLTDHGVSGMDDDGIVGEDVNHDLVRSTVVTAQASCSSARKSRLTKKLATGPSEEALRIAAELRDRISRRRSSRLSGPLQNQSDLSPEVVAETQEDATGTSIQDSISETGPTPTAAWTSSKWIKSGLLELRRKTVDEECSRDELGVSSLATPSQRAPVRTVANLRRGRSAASQTQAEASSSINTAPISTREDSFSGAITGTDPSAGTGCIFETAPEEIPEEQLSIDQTDRLAVEGESQNQLLRRQGIHVAPRRSWAPVNTTSTTDHVSSVADEALSSTTLAKVQPAIRSAILDSSTHHAGKISKAKRATKSVGTSLDPPARRATRRQSAPSQSQAYGEDMQETISEPATVDHAARIDYTAATSKGSSPFLFRKRGGKVKKGEVSNASTSGKSKPKKNSPLSKDSSNVTLSNGVHPVSSGEVNAKAPIPAKTPSRRVDFSSTGQPVDVASASNTPLTDQHLNKILPRKSDRRSSSIRKALREELLTSGAEFSRVNDDLTDNGTIGDNTEHSQPQLWPGTQVLLAKAQTDLFTSPEKPDPSTAAAAHTTSSQAGATREPLKQLSQEQARAPLPSTQALLDGWQGWSSVKKPRRKSDDLKRKSLVLSPTVLRKGGRNEDMRRSSLRFEADFTLAGENEEVEDEASHGRAGATMIPQSLSTTGEFSSNLPALRSSADKDVTTSSSDQSIDTVAPNRRPRPVAAHRQQVPLTSSHNFQMPSTLSLHAGFSSVQADQLHANRSPKKSSGGCLATPASVRVGDVAEEEDGPLRLSFQQAQVWEDDSFGFDSTTDMAIATVDTQTHAFVSGIGANMQHPSQQESQVSSSSVVKRKKALDSTSQLSQDLDGLLQDVLEKSTAGFLGGTDGTDGF
ncbi:unnamed protein product [Zymoseptoria tritici ST99CH_1A5]|uniref:Uncharacterized protein n=1 Tax=Zymoseptoria tritici ST99CH_1A5 TaxID=1276529 RepID=A0A1Y6LUC9_ZYMTR|nr:unnamed protein product [Zymoseptoria tritici ST99CH_1A5]